MSAGASAPALVEQLGLFCQRWHRRRASYRPAGEVFDPRYAVELTATGTLNVAPSTAMPRMPRMQRASRGRVEGPTYIFRCAVCGKTINKKKMDGTLNAHKNKQGYPCYGRYGMYVRTKY